MGPTEARSPLSCAWLRCRRGLWNLPDRARSSIWAEVLTGLSLLRAQEHRTGRSFIRNVREKRWSWAGDRLPGAREAGRRRGAPSAAATCTVPRHSTVQMAIFPSSGPEPLSTYLSSAEHSALTVSACATSSFSTVLLSASTT